MHCFEYDDAREAFVEAQKADPGFAMAYWGEAMTFNHAVWQRTSPDLAKAALTSSPRRPMRAAPRRRPKRKRTGSAPLRNCSAPAKNSRAISLTPSR